VDLFFLYHFLVQFFVEGISQYRYLLFATLPQFRPLHLKCTCHFLSF
jgi:hypothetical protein